MGYLTHIGLGQDEWSATKSLHADIGAWIQNERLFVGSAHGLADEAAILAALSKALPRGTVLPAGHPCRGISGKSICDQSDLEAGYEMATAIGVVSEADKQKRLAERKRQAASKPIDKQQLAVIAGIGLVGFLLLMPPKRRR